MFYSLCREYWPAFMDCIARNLLPGGRAAIQFIAMRDELFEGYARNADFIQAYVFPGGLLIKTSEFRALAEARGLVWTDQADFGEHYAETLKAWNDPGFCAEKLGLDEPLGEIDPAKINVNGSSLAAGHPFGATGGRIVATLAKLLAERGEGRGLISICAAGGQGVTAILERKPAS